MAGFLAGVAGALFAFFGRYASASYMFYHVSGEAVVWAIVGGAGTLLGPLVGTAIFIVVREIVSTHWEHHALIVGRGRDPGRDLRPQRRSSACGTTGSTRLTERGAEPGARDQAADRAMSEPVLRTEELTKRFGGLDRRRQI